MGDLQYNSKINMYYILEDEIIEILPTSILNVTISHNYDTATMPTILVALKLNYKIYDKVVNNIDKGLFRFSLKRYNVKSSTSIKKNDIDALFTYIIPTNVEYNRDLIDERNDADTYKSGIIGLLSLDSINQNRNIYNAVIKDSNMISVIHKYTNHMNMIIEPFRSNSFFKTLIIPPISTLTNLISYLNNDTAFYDTKYRYFRDFNKTYLLSSSGNAVYDKDSKYDSVIIELTSSASDKGKTTGFDINQTAKAYILKVDAADTSMNKDITSDLQCNCIVAFDYDADINKVYFDTAVRKDDKDRSMIIREDDLNTIKSLKSTVDSTSIVLNIVRSDIDSSILTPNKEYIIKNYDDYKEYNGRFLLSYKKEIFLQQGDDFISSVAFGLRKVME